MLFTEENFLALIRSAEGTPYLFGGIDPFHGGADCSGLIYWAAKECGVTLPRTTQAEWAGLPHSTDLSKMPVGAIVEFEVPSDGGSPPQHVGINMGGGVMIDDPHTGAFVRQETIPNEPGVIWPIGYCLLPFVAPPTPAPVSTTGDNMLAVNLDHPESSWALAPDGGVDSDGTNAPWLGGLNGNRFNWTAVGKLSGISAWRDPKGGMGYKIAVQTASPVGEGGGWFDYYRFPADGSLRSSSAVRWEETDEGKAHLAATPVEKLP